MTAEAFYALTYAELALTIEGYTERLKQSKRHLAWAVAWLLQPHAKEGVVIEPAQLLGEGPRKPKEEKWLTLDDAAAELARMQAKEIKVEVKNV